MKNKFIKRLKKSWLTIWIVAAVAALSTIGGMAAYTSISSVKRVVSTQKGVGNLFSSNYLEEGSSFPLKNVTFSSDKIAPTVTVNVCNFPQTKIKHSDADITYTLTITLVDSGGKEVGDIENIGNYSVSYNNTPIAFSSEKKEIRYENQTLSASDFSYNDFTLTFDSSQLTTQNVFMKLEAKPSSSSGLPTLSAMIGVSYVKPYSASWSGQFTDSADKPSDLDGFNYRLSGSGSGTITLSWNTKYIEISKWFLKENNLDDPAADSNGIKTITLTVDSSKQNQYDIQFYRVNGISANESWTTNNESISIGDITAITTCEFKADEATE
ncbi:hypothetical protein [Ruminococcus sp.]|uniref:hypothetical protein n=1 Tax=Ruminococcus sp. TaxID=41978 RepID=UPI0025E6D360|nr:hypothetical protein [Ruminococcus sp.]